MESLSAVKRREEAKNAEVQKMVNGLVGKNNISDGLGEKSLDEKKLFENEEDFDVDDEDEESNEDEDDGDLYPIKQADLIHNPESQTRQWLRSRGKTQYIDFSDDERKLLRDYFDSLDDDQSG